MEWNIKKTHPLATIPSKGYNSEDAGYDLSCVPDEEWANYGDEDAYFYLLPGESKIFHTGLKCSFTPEFVALLWDRGGMGAKNKVHRLAGVIDSSYRGEWLVCLTNHGNKAITIQPCDKIVQVIFQSYYNPTIVEVDELDESDRGEGRFGSSEQIRTILEPENPPTHPQLTENNIKEAINKLKDQ